MGVSLKGSHRKASILRHFSTKFLTTVVVKDGTGIIMQYQLVRGRSRVIMELWVCETRVAQIVSVLTHLTIVLKRRLRSWRVPTADMIQIARYCVCMQFVDVGTTIGPIKLAKGIYPFRVSYSSSTSHSSSFNKTKLSPGCVLQCTA